MTNIVLKQVKENLLFANLWTEVEELELSGDTLLQGIPKEPLLTDEDGKSSSPKEIVLPINLETKLTVRKLKSIFDELESVTKSRPKRIITGIVNDDSTVVYYFVHDGVYKPKKN